MSQEPVLTFSSFNGKKLATTIITPKLLLILLMEEILHQLVGSLSHCYAWFYVYIPGGFLAGFLNHQHYDVRGKHPSPVLEDAGS